MQQQPWSGEIPWTYMPRVGGWPDHVQSQCHCAAELILTTPQTKSRVAIDMGHDESPGEPKGVGRSWQREARETKKPRRCQPQISQTTQRMLDFNAHCLALFRVWKGTRWSVLKERGRHGWWQPWSWIKKHRIKGMYTELRHWVEKCPPEDSTITRLGTEAPSQQDTHPAVSGSPEIVQGTPCPQRFCHVKVKFFSLLLWLRSTLSWGDRNFVNFRISPHSIFDSTCQRERCQREISHLSCWIF